MTQPVPAASLSSHRLLRARTGDVAAIGLSGLCMAHCLVLPLAAAALPLLGAWAEAEWVHWLFALIAAPVSLWTFSRHDQRGLLRPATLVAALGVLLLFAGAAGFPSHAWETQITVAGGLMLTAAHLANISGRRRTCHEAH